MRQFLREVSSRLTAQVLAMILLPLLLSTATLASNRAQGWIDTAIPQQWQGRVAGCLFVLLCGSVAWIVLLARRLQKAKPIERFMDDCVFDDKLGAYRHKTRPGYYCGSCTPKGIVSPLRDAGHGWQCEIKECSKFHPDPSRPQPKPVMPQAIFTPRHLGPGDMRMG